MWYAHSIRQRDNLLVSYHPDFIITFYSLVAVVGFKPVTSCTEIKHSNNGATMHIN